MKPSGIHAPLYRQGHGELKRYGVVLSHGFTGSPASIRPWAMHLADAGFTVSMPLLTGHGKTWQDLVKVPWQRWYTDIEAAYLELASRCEAVFAAGMSMGGALVLRLAQHHPVAALALVNPAVRLDAPHARFAGLLRHVLPSVPSIGNDILSPGAEEYAYPRTPVAAVHQLHLLLRDTRDGLSRVEAPVMIFHSDVDHIVGPRSLEILQKRLGSREVRTLNLRNSYHVATLDHDAPEIFSRTESFFKEVTSYPADPAKVPDSVDPADPKEQHG